MARFSEKLVEGLGLGVGASLGIIATAYLLSMLIRVRAASPVTVEIGRSSAPPAAVSLVRVD